MSGEFGIGVLVGLTLMRVIYWWCGGYNEQEAYAQGHQDGMAEGNEVGHYIGYHKGARDTERRIAERICSLFERR